MVRDLTLALLVVLAGASSSRLDVRKEEGRITLKARAVPLWQVVERLASEAGLTVTYDGPKPSLRVTLILEAPTAKELISKALNGQPVSYAFWPYTPGKPAERLLIGLPPPAVPLGASQPARKEIESPRQPAPASGPRPKFPASASQPG